MSGQPRAQTQNKEPFSENGEPSYKSPSKQPHLSLTKTEPEAFVLDADLEADGFILEVESVPTSEIKPATQPELFLPTNNPEEPEPSPQLEFESITKPILAINLDDGRSAEFQHAANLLESLEAQDIEVHYQCREGYCGSCRTTLIEGEIHYTQEPMAWINEDEILPCCCIPKTNLKIKL